MESMKNIRNKIGEKRGGSAISLSNPSSSQICGKAAGYGSLPEDNARTAGEIRSIICTRHGVYSKKRIYASIPATHVAAFQNVDPRDWHVAYVGLFHRFSRILSRYLFKFVTFLFFSPSRQIISSRVEKFGRSCFFFFVITSVSPLFLSLLHFFSFSKFCDSFNYIALSS